MVLARTTRWQLGLNGHPYPEGCPLATQGLEDHLLPIYEPSIEVRESHGCLLFVVDLPGLALEDVEVLLSEDLLIISGEREKEPLGDYDQVFLRERTFGTFSSSFPLPCGVDGAEATATLQDGVLRVLLPKAHREPPRRLPISPDAPCGVPRSSPPPRPSTCPRSRVQPHPRPS